MKKKSFKNIVLLYLLQYRLVIITFIVFTGIFAAIFSLYQLETEAVLYAAILCAIVGILLLSVHFIGHYRRHRRMERLLTDPMLFFEDLPKAKGLVETDYEQVLKELAARHQTCLYQWHSERRDMIDYYTTWVHQIKTPIAAMKMTLQSEDTKECRELLSELFRIEQYVELVLCYFRLDNNASDFVFGQYELDDIIRQAVRKYAPQFIHKRLQLKYEPTEAKVLTDEKWLTFLIEQVLSNAIKYTNEGSVSISEEGKIVKIQDTGIGIASEDIPRIFEKGYTGYNGRTDKKATGLGLYLCRLTAEKLSHKIWVESAVGDGTTVYIDLNTKNLEVE